jgi:hypothetical protein
MSMKRKIQDLEEATARGEASLASGDDAHAAARALEAALGALSEGVGPEWVEEFERGLAVHRRLNAKLSRLDDAMIREIPPCPTCRSAQLLLADACWIDGLHIAMGKTGIAFAMVVCPQCGDTRFWYPGRSALGDLRNEHGEPCFRSINVPGGDRGPFR